MFDSDEDSAFVILTPPMYYTYHGYREGVICPLVTTNLPTRVIVKDMEVRYTERNLVCAFHERIVQIFLKTSVIQDQAKSGGSREERIPQDLGQLMPRTTFNSATSY